MSSELISCTKFIIERILVVNFERSELVMLIRKAVLNDARSIAVVHVATWRRTYQRILPKETLRSLTYDNREALWAENINRSDNEVWVIENDGGTVVGYAATSKREKLAHLNTYNLTSIYILPSYQGRGWGKMLMRKMFNFYKEQQAELIYVGVLKDNPACAFYEYLGAEKVKTVSIDFSGKLIDEVIYRWNAVDEVLAKVN